MEHCNCRFYDGTKGNLFFVRPPSANLKDHRGGDTVGLPRTSEANKQLLAPYKSEIEYAGDGRPLGGTSYTWGNLVKGKMLEGPYKGESWLVAHLNAIHVKRGDIVAAGTPVGLEGWTGYTVPSGPGGRHCHIERLRGWTVLDPMPLLGIPNRKSGVEYINDYRPGGGGTEPTPGNLQVGNVVAFLGGKHCQRANGSGTQDAKAGPARITIISPGSPYPYHVVHTDGKSNVYGWVAASAIKEAQGQSPEPAPAPVTQYKVGDRLVFSSGYLASMDLPEKALHVAKKQLSVDRGIVAEINYGARNPYLMESARDVRSPICWCNNGDIRGRW